MWRSQGELSQVLQREIRSRATLKGRCTPQQHHEANRQDVGWSQSYLPAQD